MPEVADGTLSFLLGQNASRDPDQIPKEAFAAGINVNIQRDLLSPRWGFKEVEFTFPSGGIQLPNLEIRPYNIIFESGRFQAWIPYVAGNTYYIIVVISGIIYAINQEDNSVVVIPISDGSFLDESAPRINWSYGGRFLVIFDFPARPVIIENLTARRSDPAASEVPISVLGTYNQNRLAISNIGNEYTLGDPSGSLATPDAPITFKEVEDIGSTYFGQIFQLPTAYNDNQITYMGFLQVTDTSSGIGPMLLGTNKEIYAAATNQPRFVWENSQFASILTFNNGIAGPRAAVNVNSDFFFMSADGEIRSLAMSREEQKKYSKVPMSREVQNWLKFYDLKLTSYAALSYFKNKVFVTANPIRVDAYALDGTPIIDVCHGGLVVLEMDTISTATDQSPPAWAGLWTGIRPMDMCINNERFFVISKDRANVNRVYEMTPDKTYDQLKTGIRQVKSRIYTRAYNFENSYVDKEINYLDTRISNVKGEFKLEVKYKPSQAEKFVPWRTFEHTAPWQICEMPVGCEFNGLEAHQFKRVNFGSPREAAECNEVTGEDYSIFRSVQLQLNIEGIYWEIMDWMIIATSKSQNKTQTDVCRKYPEIKICKECNTDWTMEENSICQ